MTKHTTEVSPFFIIDVQENFLSWAWTLSIKTQRLASGWTRFLYTKALTYLSIQIFRVCDSSRQLFKMWPLFDSMFVYYVFSILPTPLNLEFSNFTIPLRRWLSKNVLFYFWIFEINLLSYCPFYFSLKYICRLEERLRITQRGNLAVIIFAGIYHLYFVCYLPFKLSPDMIPAATALKLRFNIPDVIIFKDFFFKYVNVMLVFLR